MQIWSQIIVFPYYLPDLSINIQVFIANGSQFTIAGELLENLIVRQGSIYVSNKVVEHTCPVYPHVAN